VLLALIPGSPIQISSGRPEQAEIQSLNFPSWDSPSFHGAYSDLGADDGSERVLQAIALGASEGAELLRVIERDPLAEYRQSP
jgi:hypothetical protein